MLESQGDALVRKEFIKLENKYSVLEGKFDEMRTVFGG